MIVMPAVGLGILVVFLVGAGVTYVALEQVARRTKANPALAGTWRQGKPGYLTEGRMEKLALLGGGLAVVLLILSLLVIPKEWALVIWIVLTALGILFGLLTFLMNRPATGAEHRPPPSAEVPPRQKGEYRPPPSTGAPPGQGDRYRPPASTRVSPPAREDPYRDLLAKTRYDQDLADRLIEQERKRMPLASLDDLCRSAIRRLERDNR
jgi:hypothetical protein